MKGGLVTHFRPEPLLIIENNGENNKMTDKKETKTEEKKGIAESRELTKAEKSNLSKEDKELLKEVGAKKLTAAYNCPDCGELIELPFTNPEDKWDKLARTVYLELEKNKERCWRCKLKAERAKKDKTHRLKATN